MRMVDQLRSFHRRRIALPVSDDALVLDVGSGDKPSWRADVLLDRYPGAEQRGQRSGADEARVTRPLFDADAEDMPFADGAFDYVICSHLLEHVPDPARVIAELQRVARAGYIEVPEAASAKIVDFPSHLWWIRLDTSGPAPVLDFTAKQAPWFDEEIHRYVRESGVERELTAVLDGRFDARVICLPWEGSIAHRVHGQVDPELLRAALTGESPHRGGESLLARAITLGLTGRRQRSLRRRSVKYDDIVKPTLRRGDDRVLERRVYRFG
ncbi:class I SAM-dependent methyltransferase [Nocardioides sp.]|uniref:class I SAM-dependent methyltransferase n=1 Tax=Nocardioides sp. TaxID=35761 RepID=UPI0027330F7F|nr:methyltransferase domain-containing protein [Nocardioides sp.]MDP3894608.1 methyltransferase domain-containing protein [Nocardioides sp.]